MQAPSFITVAVKTNTVLRLILGGSAVPLWITVPTATASTVGAYIVVKELRDRNYLEMGIIVGGLIFATVLFATGTQATHLNGFFVDALVIELICAFSLIIINNTIVNKNYSFLGLLLVGLSLAYVGFPFAAYYRNPIQTNPLTAATTTNKEGHTVCGSLIAHADGYWYVVEPNPLASNATATAQVSPTAQPAATAKSRATAKISAAAKASVTTRPSATPVPTATTAAGVLLAVRDDNITDTVPITISDQQAPCLASNTEGKALSAGPRLAAAPTATASQRPTSTSIASRSATPSAQLSASPTSTALPPGTGPATSATAIAAMATPNTPTTITATPGVSTTVTATLGVRPSTINPGGLITIDGAGFAPNETVRLLFDQNTGTATSGRVNSSGRLLLTGVTLPYTSTVGIHAVIADGVSSGRTARTRVTVQALTPRISLIPTTAEPGDRVRVVGRGFGAQEQVTVALDGAALISSPSAIVTKSGAFAATVAIPNSILRGANTVSAIGNLSRVVATATLTGTLPVASRFYYAGGVETATEHSSIHMLNATNRPATVHLTFYSDAGKTNTHTVTLASATDQVVSVADLTQVTGSFGLYIEADRQISTGLSLSRDGMDGDVLQGNAGTATQWYLAEGYTGLAFKEQVTIFNTNAATARVQLRLLPLGGLSRKSVLVTVAPLSVKVVDINSEAPKRSLGILATADRPVVVERTLTFSKREQHGATTPGYGMTTRAGVLTPATSWLSAEGTTENHFQTFLTILNPNASSALVTASFYGRTHTPMGSKTVRVPAWSRANIKINDVIPSSSVATIVQSDNPIVVERPEYFGSPNDADIAGSDTFGLNGLGTTWNFPAGDTRISSEYLLLFAPSPAPMPIDVTFFGKNGKVIHERISVPPWTRYNIHVNDVAGLTGFHGVTLHSINGRGFIAEQTIFTRDRRTLRSTQGMAQ